MTALRKVLVVAASDPAQNGRVAEAIRLAAGIGGWEKVKVQICFCGPAVQALDESVDELINGDVVATYLPLLLEQDSTVHLLRGGRRISEPLPGVKTVTISQLASLTREADCVMRF